MITIKRIFISVMLIYTMSFISIASCSPESADESGRLSKRALMNVWHIPNNAEPPTVHMRNPVHPGVGDDPVRIYCGGYPQGTIWSGAVRAHEVGTPYWQNVSFTFDSNNGNNEYWITQLSNQYEPGDSVAYVLEMHGNPSLYDTTFIYGNDTASYVTSDENTAWTNPFIFTLPTATPTPAGQTPTPTPTQGNQMLNVWHIPGNQEPPTVTMRNPLYPLTGQSPVYIYCGAYPTGTIWSGQVIYHKSGTPYWSSASFTYDSTQGSNEYFVAQMDNPYSHGDRVAYILELHGGPGTQTTYVYGTDTASHTTTDSNVAYNSPFSFVVDIPPSTVPAVTPFGIGILILAISVCIGIKRTIK